MSCSDPSRMIASPYPSSTRLDGELAVEVEVEPRRERRVLGDPAAVDQRIPLVFDEAGDVAVLAVSLAEGEREHVHEAERRFLVRCRPLPEPVGAELCRRVAAEPVERRPVAVRRERGDRSSEPLLTRVELVEPVRVGRAGVEAEGARRRARHPPPSCSGPGASDPCSATSCRRNRDVTTNAATSNATKTTATTTRRRPAARRRSGRSDSVDRTGRRRPINVGGHRLHSANGLARERPQRRDVVAAARRRPARVRRVPLGPLDRRSERPTVTRSSRMRRARGWSRSWRPIEFGRRFSFESLNRRVPRSAGTSASIPRNWSSRPITGLAVVASTARSRARAHGPRPY